MAIVVFPSGDKLPWISVDRTCTMTGLRSGLNDWPRQLTLAIVCAQFSPNSDVIVFPIGIRGRDISVFSVESGELPKEEGDPF
jgi:hypothetical protein